MSNRLRELYELEPNECYDNMFKLLREYEIEYQVIGYIKTTGLDFLIRHSWGIKDGEIIEGTLNPDKVEAFYPLVELNMDDWTVLASERDNLFTGLMDYDYKKEMELLDNLVADGILTEDEARLSLFIGNGWIANLIMNDKELLKKYSK